MKLPLGGVDTTHALLVRYDALIGIDSFVEPNSTPNLTREVLGALGK
jgi:hypothetical protein